MSNYDEIQARGWEQKAYNEYRKCVEVGNKITEMHNTTAKNFNEIQKQFRLQLEQETNKFRQKNIEFEKAIEIVNTRINKFETIIKEFETRNKSIADTSNNILTFFALLVSKKFDEKMLHEVIDFADTIKKLQEDYDTRLSARDSQIKTLKELNFKHEEDISKLKKTSENQTNVIAELEKYKALALSQKKVEKIEGKDKEKSEVY